MRATADDLWNRIYGDFLMPSRLGLYRRVLETALLAGYGVHSLERFYQLVMDGDVHPAERYVILRHDIDTDARTAGAMWQIEQGLGVHGSYYFRLSTLDIPLMQAIGEAGGQASYHYEDLSTVAKRRCLRSREDAAAHMSEVQDSFRHNLERLRAMTGLPMRVVAAHGDFVNRKLGIPNWALLADRQFRREVGVDLEAYDEELLGHVSSRHSDTLHPKYWIPEDPLAAIHRGEPVVHLLVHPRHWQVSRLSNVRDDFRRLEEGLLYRWRCARVSR